MHPIERLRYVARASGGEPSTMVRETAGALAALGLDPPGLVTAARRIVDRHPSSGVLWWLCSRMLTAADARHEAWACVDEVDDDPTAAALAALLPDGATLCVVGESDLVARALVRRGDVAVLAVDSMGEGMARVLTRRAVDVADVPSSGVGAAAAAADLVVVDALAAGPDGAVAAAGARAAAAVARTEQRPVWLVAGVGRCLPSLLWRGVAERMGDEEPWQSDEEKVPIELFTELVGPDGCHVLSGLLERADCPPAPELLRSSPF